VRNPADRRLQANGALEYWSAGVLEYRSIGVLEYGDLFRFGPITASLGRLLEMKKPWEGVRLGIAY
jgi:hypothetical protein